MFRPALMFLLALLMVACANNNDKKKDATKKEEGSAAQALAAFFNEGTLPYQLTDNGLSKAGDTATLQPSLVSSFLADSVKSKYFGKSARLTYHPLARFSQKGKETYYTVKATGNGKSAAFLLVFDKQNNYAASYPFLLPDEDESTSQTSSLDKNFTVTKTVTQRAGTDVTGEGKEVVAYDASTKSFSLIMMDALNDNPAELRNPIDTFPKKNKLSGDYFLNKRNLIAVRDGRYSNQILVYIHTENESGDCVGQLKGEFILTTSTTAAFRQGGDPCVLNLSFNGNTVSMAEQRGCGNYRGLDCPLTGTFTRKKSQSPKAPSAKPKRK